MNWFTFIDIKNNKTIINTFNIDDSNITYIMAHHQIMATIAYRIFKFEHVIKTPTMTNYTFSTVITFSNINFITQINSIIIQHL